MIGTTDRNPAMRVTGLEQRRRPRHRRTPPIRMVSRWIAQAARRSRVRRSWLRAILSGLRNMRTGDPHYSDRTGRRSAIGEGGPYGWRVSSSQASQWPLRLLTRRPPAPETRACQTASYVLDATARELSPAAPAMATVKVLSQASQPAPVGNATELANAAATFAVAAAKSNQRIQK